MPMDFRDDARLDTSQVEDVGGRGGGFPGGGLAIGGGITGIIALIAALLFGVNPGDILGGGEPAGLAPTSDLSGQCRTGEDADQSERCRVVGVVNSVQAYWEETLGEGRTRPPRPSCSPARSTRPAAPPTPPSAPSTAPPTSGSTWT
ncbi:neutral zinc metallopeptidase [Thermocatellispora tengchongensis]|uniref:neutral zinc metallopeptidase n=1 Tax=Thermocatellispora tengchongensis TaxID=1073253 RepID=UPI003626B207